jgi:hypothetical protein
LEGRESVDDSEGVAKVTGEPEDEHRGGCPETQLAKITTSESGGVLFVQRHIRQHMPTRPGIIIPVVPFASWADKGRALVVMGPIITDGDGVCQNASAWRAAGVT